MKAFPAGYITNHESQEGTGDGKMQCNHDCFNCKYSDCVSKNNDKTTPWERDVLKGALGGWERQSTDKYVKFMLNSGIPANIIGAILHKTKGEMEDSIKRIKRAAKGTAIPKAAGRKLNTNIISV